MAAIQDVTIEAARDVGAGPARVLRDIVLPQCRGGLMTAFTLSFLISIGDYVTPRFVGGGAALMGTFIENQFSIGFNWPLGSAMAFTTLAVGLALWIAVPSVAVIVLLAMHCVAGSVGLATTSMKCRGVPTVACPLCRIVITRSPPV